MIEKRPDPLRIAKRIDRSAILDLDRNSLVTEGQDEIDLRLPSSFRQMEQLETTDRQAVRAGDAFGEVFRQIGEMRNLSNSSGTSGMTS